MPSPIHCTPRSRIRPPLAAPSHMPDRLLHGRHTLYEQDAWMRAWCEGNVPLEEAQEAAQQAAPAVMAKSAL